MGDLLATTDQIFEFITGHTPVWLYLFVFGSMLFENFFPPYPGDTVIFLGAVYASGGYADWTTTYIISVAGTMISVMILFYLGNVQGRAVFAKNKFKWMNQDRLGKIERWFARWGEKVLLISRFVVGSRAGLALFAGVGDIRPWKMFIYSLISAATWNFLIMYLGVVLRRNWREIDTILGTYSTIVYIILAVLVVFLVVRILRRRRKRKAV